MFHSLFVVWFNLVKDWHYLGVLLLMALESTIFPVPSEVVVPPAAYWASQGLMNFWVVWLVATLGSYLGSIVSYWVARHWGHDLLYRYGRYVFLTPQKLRFAERWTTEYGVVGLFIARMLPVVRHLISLPAGALRMNVWKFSFATIAGSGVWCYILAWFGQKVIGDQPELLSDPNIMIHVMRDKLIYIVLAFAIVGGLYGVIHRQIHKTNKEGAL
ncbi:MAG: DedA family protein [Deltaproteobacteria bacterium CG11_big_fil_rev_8_21_14_0_20_47_16]|nr:MAG: DedA family protein [Deltaproteobacteria bacterium CG11_big_fil_rev_8_21_14_0_20_47_16]